MLKRESIRAMQALWVAQGLRVLRLTSMAITPKLLAVLPEDNWI